MDPGNRMYIHTDRLQYLSRKSCLHLSITSRVEPDIIESCLCILTRTIWCFQVSERLTCPHRTRRENLNTGIPLRTGLQTDRNFYVAASVIHFPFAKSIQFDSLSQNMAVKRLAIFSVFRNSPFQMLALGLTIIYWFCFNFTRNLNIGKVPKNKSRHFPWSLYNIPNEI